MTDNIELMQQLFNSDLGQKLQRENTDKDLEQREQLVLEIERNTKAMYALIDAPDEIRAKRSLEEARAAVKAAEKNLSNASAENYKKRKELEKEKINIERSLIKLAPSYINNCQKAVLERNNNQVSHFSKIDDLRGLINEVDSWRTKALSFDEMKSKFKKIEEKMLKMIAS